MIKSQSQKTDSEEKQAWMTPVQCSKKTFKATRERRMRCNRKILRRLRRKASRIRHGLPGALPAHTARRGEMPQKCNLGDLQGGDKYGAPHAKLPLGQQDGHATAEAFGITVKPIGMNLVYTMHPQRGKLRSYQRQRRKGKKIKDGTREDGGQKERAGEENGMCAACGRVDFFFEVRLPPHGPFNVGPRQP